MNKNMRRELETQIRFWRKVLASEIDPNGELAIWIGSKIDSMEYSLQGLTSEQIEAAQVKQR